METVSDFIFGGSTITADGDCLVTSREIYGETVETVADLIFLGSKITADGNCRHGIKRHSLEEKL